MGLPRALSPLAGLPAQVPSLPCGVGRRGISPAPATSCPPSREKVCPCRREPRAGRTLLRQRPRRHTRPPPPQPAAETERKDSRRHSSSLSGVPWKPGGEARTERTPRPRLCVDCQGAQNRLGGRLVGSPRAPCLLTRLLGQGWRLSPLGRSANHLHTFHPDSC